MSFQPMPYLFAVLLALGLSTKTASAQSTYNKAELDAAAARLRDIISCNQSTYDKAVLDADAALLRDIISCNQSTYDKAVLDADAARLRGTTSCNPMLDPGCQIRPTPKGPPGCTDCDSFSLFKALRKDEVLLLPDSLEINGNKLQILKENTGSGTLFSIPTPFGRGLF